MNISEANDVNHVLRWALDAARGRRSASNERIAREAAIRLAGRAHKTLSAGYTAEQVNDWWPQPQPQPSRRPRRRRDLSGTARCGYCGAKAEYPGGVVGTPLIIRHRPDCPDKTARPS